MPPTATRAAAALAAGSALLARPDYAAEPAWSLGVPPACAGDSRAPAPRAAAPRRIDEPAGPAAASGGPAVLAGAALAALAAAAAGRGRRRRASPAVGARAYGTPRLTSSSASAILSAASDTAEDLKERIMARRAQSALGSSERAAALLAKLDRAAGPQGSRSVGAGGGGARGFGSGGTALGLQASGGSGPASVLTRAAAALARPPDEVEMAAGVMWELFGGGRKSRQRTSSWPGPTLASSGPGPTSVPPRAAAAPARPPGAVERAAVVVREQEQVGGASGEGPSAPLARGEARGGAGAALPGLARACEAIFGEAAPRMAADARELRGGPEGALAWAGRALFAELPAVMQPAVPRVPRGREEHRAGQWARVQALEDRHAKLMESHGALLEKLQNL